MSRLALLGSLHGQLPEVLVTGAGGFIGTRLTRELRRSGTRVRALVREDHDVSALETLGAQIIRGDATHGHMVQEAATGCNAIFHLAAARGHKKLSAREFCRRNVVLCETVARAAIQAGGIRLVVTSSAPLSGYSGPKVQSEAIRAVPNSGYRLSRQLADQRLDQLRVRDGLEVVIARVCPRVLGPGARTWQRLVSAIRDGRSPLVASDARIHSGDVDDVVSGLICCATTPGISGERLLLAAARPIRSTALMNRIAQRLAVPFTPRIAPAAPLRAYVALGNLWFQLTRTALPHHFVAEQAAGRASFDIGRAERVLGFVPRFDMTEAVDRTVDWLVEEGLV